MKSKRIWTEGIERIKKTDTTWYPDGYRYTAWWHLKRTSTWTSSAMGHFKTLKEARGYIRYWKETNSVKLEEISNDRT